MEKISSRCVKVMIWFDSKCSINYNSLITNYSCKILCIFIILTRRPVNNVFFTTVLGLVRTFLFHCIRSNKKVLKKRFLHFRYFQLIHRRFKGYTKTIPTQIYNEKWRSSFDVNFHLYNNENLGILYILYQSFIYYLPVI